MAMTTAQAYPGVLAALCIWREARGESREAMRAVYHVILNRTVDGCWPHDVTGVIRQPKQFSSFNPGDANAALFPDPGSAAWRMCCEVVDDPGDDPTLGSTHYHSIPEGKPLPSWADPAKIRIRIGAFTFYRL